MPTAAATLAASLAAGRDWLDAHAPDLLPDAVVFAEIGLRAAGLPLPERLRRGRAGHAVRALIPLTPAFRTVAAHASRVYLRYDGRPPLATESAARRRVPAARPAAGIGATIDRARINEALAGAVRGRPSGAALRWMRGRCGAGFALTHQLLASLFCVWNGRPGDASRHARRLARQVVREAVPENGYHDLLAQQTAFLALGGWPTARLRPLIRRIIASQDPTDGGWHYFETRLSSPAETLGRVCFGDSALLGWPIPCREDQLGTLARAVHVAHRGHATALSVCALGVVTARTNRRSTP